MKYTDKNPPLRCIMTGSTCWKGTRTYTPKGVLWHSTGANNTNLKRYVQPPKDDPNYSKLIKLLGVNSAHNSWQEIERSAGVSAWIGRLADGTVTTVQALEWKQRNWGVASNSLGSLNNTHIQFECCENDLKEKTYIQAVYEEACELTAYLCKKFGFDPYGTFKYQGVNVPVILCHQDSYKLKLGSNHGDIYNFFPLIGKNMDTARDDVNKLMKGGTLSSTPQIVVPNPAPAQPKPSVPEKPKEEDEDMTLDTFTKLMNEYRKTLQDNDAADWSKAARDWAVSSGLIQGGGTTVNGQPNYMWQDTVTREELSQLLYRFAQMMGKA